VNLQDICYDIAAKVLKPGDTVECMNNEADMLKNLVKGKVYTISKHRIVGNIPIEIFLEGIKNFSYAATRFRKVDS